MKNLGVYLIAGLAIFITAMALTAYPPAIALPVMVVCGIILGLAVRNIIKHRR